jgi:hypothetical protein
MIPYGETDHDEHCEAELTSHGHTPCRCYARLAKEVWAGDRRYFLASDDDGHWYVIDAARRDEWDDWREIDSEDERAWTPPPFAKSLGCSPSCVTFTDPRTVDY